MRSHHEHLSFWSTRATVWWTITEPYWFSAAQLWHCISTYTKEQISNANKGSESDMIRMVCFISVSLSRWYIRLKFWVMLACFMCMSLPTKLQYTFAILIEQNYWNWQHVLSESDTFQQRCNLKYNDEWNNIHQLTQLMPNIYWNYSNQDQLFDISILNHCAWSCTKTSLC